MTHKQQRYFEQLCELPSLMQAWKQVRANRGAAGVDQISVYEYERELLANLGELAARLREGRYWPMPLVQFQVQKANGKQRTLGNATVEDKIVGRALYDLLERVWEPVFLTCSYGFRPQRNVELAVKAVLDYRAAGDGFVVDADVADAFGSLDHEIVLGLISQRLRDKRLLGLIRLVLAAGVGCETGAARDGNAVPLGERVADMATGAVNDALSQLLGGGVGESYGAGYLPYHTYAGEPAARSPAEAAAELRKAARQEAYKRLGRDALLLGLTYAGRSRRLLSPTSLALTGAAVLATAAYPKAAAFVRQRWGTARGASGVGAVQGSPLSPMLLNIVLHEFDVAMLRAGFHLVRYADDWVVTARDAESAQRALAFAGRKLDELRLQLNPEKTRILRFEQGLEFLGYRFDRFQLTAAPPPASTQQPVRVLLNEAAMAWRERAAPALSGLGKQALDKGRAGLNRAADLVRRRGKPEGQS
jgi:retron-type reverse transcriptase